MIDPCSLFQLFCAGVDSGLDHATAFTRALATADALCPLPAGVKPPPAPEPIWWLPIVEAREQRAQTKKAA